MPQFPVVIWQVWSSAVYSSRCSSAYLGCNERLFELLSYSDLWHQTLTQFLLTGYLLFFLTVPCNQQFLNYSDLLLSWSFSRSSWLYVAKCTLFLPCDCQYFHTGFYIWWNNWCSSLHSHALPSSSALAAGLSLPSALSESFLVSYQIHHKHPNVLGTPRPPFSCFLSLFRLLTVSQNSRNEFLISQSRIWSLSPSVCLQMCCLSRQK